jgi:IclR family transcriptional regulator, KDG regulon repressor
MKTKKPISNQGMWNRTLVHGLRLLELLAADPREHTIKEIAKATSLAESHVHRLLQTLVENGYVYHSPLTRRYSIDFKTLQLSSELSTNHILCQKGAFYLRRLASLIKASTYLVVWRNNAPLIIMVDHSEGNFNQAAGMGPRPLPYMSASGRLFLALLWIDPKKILKFPSGITSNMARYKKEMNEIRKNGMSIIGEAPSSTVLAAASPIYDREGQVTAALGFAMPRAQYDPVNRDKFLSDLRETAESFSLSIGYVKAANSSSQMPSGESI